MNPFIAVTELCTACVYMCASDHHPCSPPAGVCLLVEHSALSSLLQYAEALKEFIEKERIKDLKVRCLGTVWRPSVLQVFLGQLHVLLGMCTALRLLWAYLLYVREEAPGGRHCPSNTYIPSHFMFIIPPSPSPFSPPPLSPPSPPPPFTHIRRCGPVS